MLVSRCFTILFSLLAMLSIASCSVRDTTPSPTATPDDVFVIVTATFAATANANETPKRVTSYVVQEGDSLLEIADRFDLTLSDLLEANEIEDPDSIFAGQRLTIPTPSP